MRSALSSVVPSDVCWPQVQGGPLLSMLICHRAPLAFCFGRRTVKQRRLTTCGFLADVRFGVRSWSTRLFSSDITLRQ